MATTDQLKRHRVLVVDDNLLALEVMVRMLVALGCTASASPTAAGALGAMAREAFALLVTDLQMPVMDGWELARQVRRRFPGLPILAVTGQDRTQVLARLGGSGIDRVLFKPFDLQMLGRELRSLLPAPDTSPGPDFRWLLGNVPGNPPGGADPPLPGRLGRKP
jgi:two-component system capsular synthesis sensor histidine kinase RcsC